MLGAWGEPVALVDGVVTSTRAGAAAIAIGLTLLACLLLQLSHPPAAATALLVALGSLQSPGDGITVVGGAALIAAAGVVVRRVRLGQWPPRRATHREERPGAHSPTQSAAPDLQKAA